MIAQNLQTARIVSSVAATCMALACGTNYAYSAWAPQFADRLKLSSTESNLIGAAGNFGMYASGIPIGILVDSRGVRPAAILGMIALAVGYFPLHQAYDRGSGSVPLLCVFSFLTGVGGCCAFASAIKSSALNWPDHRGTATAFPLAAFGLSAFFFSIFAQFVFPGNTGNFLFLLAAGTSGIVLLSILFLRVVPHAKYTKLPTTSGRSRPDSSPLRNTLSAEERRYRAGHEHHIEPGATAPGGIVNDNDEVSSLLSKDSLEDVVPEEGNHVDKDHRHLDIRGLAMLRYLQFWELFALMGILTGIGLMTINNLGNDASALWRHYDDSVSDDFITRRQALHVSILSVFSFLGRLCSGVGSDLLVKKLHASRFWCLVIASLIFLVAQIFALNIERPQLLFFISSLTGLAYGFLFGVYPTLVAEIFGVHGLSQNWGCMTLAPILSANIFNVFYGMVYDRHSIVAPDGDRECTDGIECYRSAYWVTFFACLLGLAVSLWAIHSERGRKARLMKEEELEHEA